MRGATVTQSEVGITSRLTVGKCLILRGSLANRFRLFLSRTVSLSMSISCTHQHVHLPLLLSDGIRLKPPRRRRLALRLDFGDETSRVAAEIVQEYRNGEDKGSLAQEKENGV